MQTYSVRLESEVFNTFRCQLAANSLDIDTKKKSIHELVVHTDIKNYNIGLIIGASGSGKTTLAKKIYGDDCFNYSLNEDLPIIEQLPRDLSYEQCASILSGIGLTSVPCWIKPIKTLSNGQRARCVSAFLMTSSEIVCIDEWTSVVDRTVAKAMSHCVQKFARNNNKKITLVSCHYDVTEWLNPDWIIDCNKQTFEDRGLLLPDERKRKEQLNFSIKKTTRDTWKYFSKYHYLSDTIPVGRNYFFGLFKNEDQIGFMAFSNYVPIRKGTVPIYHSNRVVIHPDYTGLGIGLLFVNKCCQLFKKETGYKIYAKFSSQPMLKARMKDRHNWKLHSARTQLGRDKRADDLARRGAGVRSNIKTYTFEYIGP